LLNVRETAVKMLGMLVAAVELLLENVLDESMQWHLLGGLVQKPM